MGCEAKAIGSPGGGIREEGVGHSVHTEGSGNSHHEAMCGPSQSSSAGAGTRVRTGERRETDPRTFYPLRSAAGEAVPRL